MREELGGHKRKGAQGVCTAGRGWAGVGGSTQGLPAKRELQPWALTPVSREHLLRNAEKGPGSRQ